VAQWSVKIVAALRGEGGGKKKKKGKRGGMETIKPCPEIRDTYQLPADQRPKKKKEKGREGKKRRKNEMGRRFASPVFVFLFLPDDVERGGRRGGEKGGVEKGKGEEEGHLHLCSGRELFFLATQGLGKKKKKKKRKRKGEKEKEGAYDQV